MSGTRVLAADPLSPAGSKKEPPLIGLVVVAGFVSPGKS